ncbi:hypothetical protein EJB05_47372, partial [Eragrostis curvula]
MEKVEVTMKLSTFIMVGLILINLRTCVSRDISNDYISHETGVPQKEIHSLMAGTDGRTGPPSIDHQCPLGTYPNCQGVSQNKEDGEDAVWFV